MVFYYERAVARAFKFIVSLAVIALVSYAVTYLVLVEQAEQSTYEQVKAGKLILRCDLPKGTTDVDPAQVTGYYEGQWQFDNGWSSAGNCILIVKGSKL